MSQGVVSTAVRGVGDVVAIPTVFAWAFNWVPVIAGAVATVYTALRIIEIAQHLKRTRQWPFGPFGGKHDESDKDGG